MSSRGPAPSAAMLPVEKLEADRVRKSKTLDKAIERTTLIKEEMAPGDFPALEGKASYVSQLYAHKATADEDVAPSTRTLAERIKLRKEKAHQDTVVSLEAKRLDLEQRAKRNDEEAAKLAGKLTGKKKISLADALANDKRLEAMQPGEVLREFVAEGERAPKTLEQYLAQRDHIKRQAIDSPRADTTDGGSEAGTSHTGTESARESPCANEESVDAGAVGSKMHRTAEVLRQLRQKQDAPGGPQKPTLDKLVKAIKHDLPEQEQAIHELRMKKAVFASRLEWAKQRRPDSQMRHEIGMGFTAKARQMKEVCGQLVTDIIDLAMKRIEMRPTAEQVAAEVHQWRVSKLPALMGIARHLADAVMKDVVDELIAEVSAETSGLEKASSQFAFNLLVEAVAFSHGKYDFERFDVHSELRKLRRAEEKVLAEALGQKAQMAELRAVNKAERARAGALTAEPQARSLASGGSGRRKRASSTGSAGASGAVGIEGEDELDLARPSQEVQGWDDDSEEEEDEWAGERGGLRPSLLYHQVVDAEELAALNVDDPFGVLNQRLQRLLPQRRERFGGDSSGRGVGGGAEDDLFEETVVYMAQRVFDDGNMPREQRELYMLGLKAMLQEMIRRRGDAPYGHTQQLAIAWPDGVPLTRPLVHAAGGMKPPLAAGRSVWRKFDANRAHVKFAPRPRTEHLRAAELERLFWRKVTYKPFFQGEPKVGPLVWVRDKLAPITFVSPSPSGHYLAVGTATGAVVVFDLRHEPSNPWFEVVPESSGSAGAPRCPGLPRPAVLALTWSVDSYQLLALDNTDTVRVWWMRPAPGQIIKQVDTDQRQPVEPDLALSMGPPAMATSGKAPIDDSGRVAQEQGRLGGAGAFVGVRAECVAFHRSFNLTGSQPSILVPQITGDILRIHASVCGAALPIPLARSRRTAGAAVGRDGRAPLAARTVDFLMPPQVKSTDASGQSIYRGHMGRVVYVAFLSDNTTAVSVDDLGTTNLWPAQETERTGFGWFQPSASWTPPRQLKTWRAWGPSYPLWPRKPATVGFTLFGFIGKVPDQASGLSFEDYMSEPALFDNDGELQQLEEFPMGNFLLERRILWMVRYRPEGAGHGGSAKPDPKRPGRIVREELHRPDARAGGKIGGMEPLVASTYDPPSGSLLRRSKQHVSMAKYDYKVVSASLTHSQRDLLLWCHVSAAADDPDSFSFFSCHVLNIEAMKPLTPRIDVYDHSMGACPPAFATSPTISSLGSEYMFVGLGYGHVGVFSLATGQQVSEVNYSMHEAPYFMCLSLFTISDAHGCSTRNVGKTILCAVAPDSRHVHMLEVNDELSTLEAAAARQARAAAAHASAVGGGGSSPGSPRSPHGGHHGGIPLPPLPSSPGPPGLRLGSASLAASASGRAASVPTAAMGSGGGGGGRLSRASSGREGEDPAGTDGSRGESSGGEGGGGAVGQRSSSTPGGAAAARAASPRAGNGGSSGVRAGSR